MDNYEINILRRGGNWKKVKPDDLLVDETDNEKMENVKLNNKNLDQTFFSYISEINSIVAKLETLEIEKNNLKKDLKTYENKFSKEKDKIEDKINEMSLEKEMIEKTINIIKNLKNF